MLFELLLQIKLFQLDLSVLILLKHLLKLHSMKRLQFEPLLLVTNYLLLLSHNILFVQVILLSHELVILGFVIFNGEWRDAHHALGNVCLLVMVYKLIVGCRHEP